jgi:mRNA interferase MazF
LRDYRRGSIWLVNFDPSIGTEIRKRCDPEDDVASAKETVRPRVAVGRKGTLTKTRAPRKTRPALIISPTDFNNVRSKVALLPISSTKVKAKTIKPVVVEVKPSSTNGLTIDSIVIAIEPNTFDRKRLVQYLGILEQDLMNKVESIFQKFFEVQA